MQPNRPNQSESSPVASDQDQPSDELPFWPCQAPVSPLGVQAENAFYRNLPELLKKHCRQWVAYRGNECVGFARTETELYQRCLQRGFKPEDFVVLYVHHRALYDHEEIDLPPDV